MIHWAWALTLSKGNEPFGFRVFPKIHDNGNCGGTHHGTASFIGRQCWKPHGNAPHKHGFCTVIVVGWNYGTQTLRFCVGLFRLGGFLVHAPKRGQRHPHDGHPDTKVSF